MSIAGMSLGSPDPTGATAANTDAFNNDTENTFASALNDNLVGLESSSQAVSTTPLTTQEQLAQLEATQTQLQNLSSQLNSLIAAGPSGLSNDPVGETQQFTAIINQAIAIQNDLQSQFGEMLAEEADQQSDQVALQQVQNEYEFFTNNPQSIANPLGGSFSADVYNEVQKETTSFFNAIGQFISAYNAKDGESRAMTLGDGTFVEDATSLKGMTVFGHWVTLAKALLELINNIYQYVVQVEKKLQGSAQP